MTNSHSDRIQIKNPFNRPPRLQKTFHPVEIDIPLPPTKPDDNARNLLLALLPMSSFLVMGLFYALVFGRTGGQTGGLGWMYALPMLGIAIFTFLIAYITFGEQKYEQRQHWLKQLRDYHRLLDKKEARLIAARTLQVELLTEKFPHPRELLRRVKNQEITIWERRREDPDFLVFRLGMGEAYSTNPIKPPDPDLNSPEIRRAFGLYISYRRIPNVPVVVDLQRIGSMALVGDRNQTVSVARALITQLCSLNSPDDVNLYLFSSKTKYKTWKWMRWLPHTNENHSGGHPSFMAFTSKRSKELLSSITRLLDGTYQSGGQNKRSEVRLPNSIVMLFDGETGVRDEIPFKEFVKDGKSNSIYSVFICEKLEDVPSDCSAVVEISSAEEFEFAMTGADGWKERGRPDKIALIEADNLSHRLLPLSVQTLGRNTRIPTRINFMQLYEVKQVDDLRIENRWGRIPLDDGLLPFPIRIGSETYAETLMVNMSENNDGPHGLIAGTTGSGKSELLQTLVCALAIEHHPYFLNFMLIDFKGASTFGVFEKLPHVVGLVSNLDKLSANRALEALNAENLRRQRFLKEQNVEEIVEYHQRLISNGTILDPLVYPMPHLFIVVDEFAQMASEMPGFLDRLNEIARVGRSLGIHLILATQRPAGIVKDEMRANLNFRICLKVQTIDDSRDMLRRPDAAYLTLPGRAYFQLGDGGAPIQFQVARSGIEYQSINIKDQRHDLYRIEYEDPDLIKDGFHVDKKLPKDSETITKAMVKHIIDLYKTMRANSDYAIMDPILLPPLERQIDIRSMTEEDWRIWWKKNWGEKWIDQVSTIRQIPSNLQIPVGRLDSLAQRSQPPYFLDFLEQGGHVMAIGSAQSGKTFFLQTVCYSLITHYNPEQVNIYVMSFAGKDLVMLEDLPHIGSVIDGSETERFHRLIRHLQNEIENRKNEFNRAGVRDLKEYNDKVSSGIPYIFTLIDGFGELRALEYDEELNEIEGLLKIGRMYGLYFIVTALQSTDIPSRLANLIQKRVAFNLTDHNEYTLLVGRLDSVDFGSLPNGRCFIKASPPLQCQMGYPPEREEWAMLIKQMNVAWMDDRKRRPLPIRELSRNEPLSLLLGQESKQPSDLQGPAGRDGDNLGPYWLNWTKTPHFLVGGPSQSGRTSLLHTLVLGLTYHYSPSQLNVVLIDASRSLAELNCLPHVVDWVTEDEGFVRNIAHFLAELDYRKSNANEVSSLPELLIVIDDYDLTCEAFNINDVILSKLGKRIRQDSSLGFHFLISVLPENSAHADFLIRQIRLSRTGISLANVETLESLGGRATSTMRNEELVAGRGYFFQRSNNKLVQFANPDQDSYEMVSSRWGRDKKAKWRHEVDMSQIERVRQESETVVLEGRQTRLVGSDSKSYINMDDAVNAYIKQQQALKEGKS